MNSLRWIAISTVLVIYITAIDYVSGQLCKEYTGHILTKSSFKFEPSKVGITFGKIFFINKLLGPEFISGEECSMFNVSKDGNDCGAITIIGDFFTQNSITITHYTKDNQNYYSIPYQVTQKSEEFHIYTFTHFESGAEQSHQNERFVPFLQNQTLKTRMEKFTIAILTVDQHNTIFGARFCNENENTEDFSSSGGFIAFNSEALINIVSKEFISPELENREKIWEEIIKTGLSIIKRDILDLIQKPKIATGKKYFPPSELRTIPINEGALNIFFDPYFLDNTNVNEETE